MGRIFAVQETTYVNEWLGMVPKKRVTALLFRENKKLMSIRSYRGYPESHVKKIYLPLSLRGRRVTTVGPLDHMIYTAACFFLLPVMLMHEAIVFVVPTFFTAAVAPFLKIFGKKIYVISLDPQDALYETYRKRKTVLLWIYWNISRFMEKLSIRCADAVFAVSPYLKDQYRKYNSRICITPNGADCKTISDTKPKRLHREFTIAYFGSVDSWRGVDMLVKAFRNAKKTARRKLKLTILGGGPEEENIRKLASGDPDIHVSGFIEHSKAVAYCKGSDLLVAPFRETPVLRKTFSIKPFEYIACGVPVIVTDTGAHANLVRELQAGLVVKPETKSIEKAIVNLADNGRLYKKLARNCRKSMWKVDYKRMRKDFSRTVYSS